MRRSFFAIGLACLIVGAAQAAAYDDFAKGLSANLRHDSAAAVESFSAAIAAGDLSPGLLPMAYRGRGLAYLRLNRCKDALADLDAALKLKPGDLDATLFRASAYRCDGDFASADADYSAALARSPVDSIYLARGFTRWEAGNFTDAATDFAQVVRQAPTYAYGVLWLEVSRQRSGSFDPAKVGDDASDVSSDGWPASLLALYAGGSSPEAVDAEAAHGDVKAAKQQSCEADFYIGEYLLWRKDMAGALVRLQRAADRCPSDQVEYHMAHVDLARLK